MKKCPRCGKSNPNDAKFCAHCGLSFAKYAKEQRIKAEKAKRIKRQQAKKAEQVKENQSGPTGANGSNAIKCPRCGHSIKAGVKFCPNCGYHFVKNNKCPNCGATVKPGTRFCPHCGHKLTAANASTEMNNHRSNVTQNVSNNDYYTDEVEGGQRYADVDKSKSVHRNWIKKYFSASFLLFWIKGNISVNYREIRINRQNTVCFGLIPAGSNITNIPLNQVSSADIQISYNIMRFIIGAILALIGFFTLLMGIGIIFLLIGIGIFANGFVTQLVIEQTSGVARYLDVPVYNRQDIEIARSAINQALNSEQDKSDLSMFFNRKR